MPLIVTKRDYVPVVHLGSVGGQDLPWWDQRAKFGDTNYLVVNPEEGASLAEALGDKMMVLMNRHGVTVARHQSHRSNIPLRLFVSQR